MTLSLGKTDGVDDGAAISTDKGIFDGKELGLNDGVELGIIEGVIDSNISMHKTF